jgi:tRNA pseudouridine38-40 synthase
VSEVPPTPPIASADPATAPPEPLRPRNIRLVIAYRGTAYHGWQKQPGLPTIQGTIQDALARIVNHPVDLAGAGRTDAGVHAMGQVGSFRTDARMPADRLMRAVNSRLPDDIAVVRADDVPGGFHATRSAVCKLYRYTVHAAALPPVHEADRAYHWWRGADVDAMRAAARLLLGRHDFSSFESTGTPRASKVRTLLRLDVFRDCERVHFDVSADGFLYNMVRNLVGTLLEIGRGFWPPEKAAGILAARDRRAAGPLAPARGLCLRWVRYPPLREIPERPEPRTGAGPADAAG